MRIGLTFTVRQAKVADRLPDSSVTEDSAQGSSPAGPSLLGSISAESVAVLDPFAAADDLEEEFDSPATIEALADAVATWVMRSIYSGMAKRLLRRYSTVRVPTWS